MRVVAGLARGRALVAPAGVSTRPTSDKVRQAIFNALESLDLVNGASVLDLFAGSGALGVEALSRGAAQACFVENDRAARACIERNLQLLPDAQVTIVPSSVERFVEAATMRFDLALVDPPYAFSGWDSLLRAVPCDFVVIESGRQIDPGPDWKIVRSRAYGSTVVVFARRQSDVRIG